MPPAEQQAAPPLQRCPPPAPASPVAPLPAPPRSGGSYSRASALPRLQLRRLPQIPRTKAAATVEVPTGTHIPLVLHNAISTRSAQAGRSGLFRDGFSQ